MMTDTVRQGHVFEAVCDGPLIRRSSHADESLTCENAPMTGAAGSVSPHTVRMTAATIESDQTDIGAQLGRIETILDRILRSLAPLAGAR